MMVKRKSNSSSDSVDATLEKGWNYEGKVAEVEGIIARIEAGELELEEVFEQFATAVKYLQQCENFLQQQQIQVDLLIETLKDD
jgi:exodeoxyribonuclease VII small subunit